MNKAALSFVFVILMLSVQSTERQSDIQDTATNDSTVQHGHSSLTQEETNLARLWMLTDNDWKKYKSLMSGPRGIWSPGLDPITVLGVSETNESERRRFAEIWMKIETRKVELELAFEVERMAAAKRLHGKTKLVKNDDWIAAWAKKHSEVRTKVSLFVDDRCVDNECKQYFNSLKNSVGDNAVLDIYFSEGATSDSAGDWASEMNIDPEVVRSRAITLNFNKGTSDLMGVDMTKLPQVRVLDVRSGEVKETFAWLE